MCVSAYLYSHNGRLEEMCWLRNFFFVSVGKVGRKGRSWKVCNEDSCKSADDNCKIILLLLMLLCYA